MSAPHRPHGRADLRTAPRPPPHRRRRFRPHHGALHEGHLSLVRTARVEKRVVVLSIFVNPTQFGEGRRSRRVPTHRGRRRRPRLGRRCRPDLRSLGRRDVPDRIRHTVSVGGGDHTGTLEGPSAAVRTSTDGGHGRGQELLVAVQPDRAYFGAKDAQQVVVVRRMVADLGLPRRDPRALPPARARRRRLARSSRNTRLSPAEREVASVVPRALSAALRTPYADGIRDPPLLGGEVDAELAAAGLAAEYVEVVERRRSRARRSRDPRGAARRGRAGRPVRLIDNVTLAPGVDEPHQHRRTHIVTTPRLPCDACAPSPTRGRRSSWSRRTTTSRAGRSPNAPGVDIVLVGDSGAQVVLGHPDTTSVTVDEMLVLSRRCAARCRRRAACDLPFGSTEVSDDRRSRTAGPLRARGRSGCRQIEGANPGAPVAPGVRSSRPASPVVGHVGLTPQTATALGGLRAQGRTTDEAVRVAREALAVQAAGAFALVIEAVPAEVVSEIRRALDIPVIGIGAGAAEGQVLVMHDLLGITEGRSPLLRQDIRGRRRRDGRGRSAPTRTRCARASSRRRARVPGRTEPLRRYGSSWRALR